MGVDWGGVLGSLRIIGVRWGVILIATAWALVLLAFPTGAAASESFVVTRLTEDDYLDCPVQISGDRLAWSKANVRPSGRPLIHPDEHWVYTWTPEDGVVNLTPNGYGGDVHSVSGDRIVWWGRDDSASPTTWTPSTGVVVLPGHFSSTLGRTVIAG